MSALILTGVFFLALVVGTAVWEILEKLEGN
jgi:hypothetical protein